MTREEIKRKKEELAQENKRLKQEEAELSRLEYEMRINNAKDKLDYMRLHREVILNLITEHTVQGCNDDNLIGAYIDHGEGRCTRCMLIKILDDDWENEYELDFNDVVVRIITE